MQVTEIGTELPDAHCNLWSKSELGVKKGETLLLVAFFCKNSLPQCYSVYILAVAAHLNSLQTRGSGLRYGRERIVQGQNYEPGDSRCQSHPRLDHYQN